MPDPTVVVPLPSREIRLLVLSPRLMMPVPLRSDSSSKVSRLAWLILMLPFRVRPFLIRSIPVLLARSSVPLSVAALRKLLPELLAAKLPAPEVLITPLIDALLGANKQKALKFHVIFANLLSIKL
jgi:hypothetical protein